MRDTGTTIAEHILGLERAALDQWGAGNPDGCLKLSTPDVTYFDPFQSSRIDGLAALTTLYNSFRGKIKIEHDEIIDPRVQVAGDAAVLTFRYDSHGSEGGMRWNCTEVYQKVGEDWRIIHTHWSLTAPAGDGNSSGA